MNPSSNLPATNDRSHARRRRFNFKLAAVLACLCLGAGLLLPFVKSRAGNHHHAMPPGQFQADLRTMVAGVRYLLEPEPARDKLPAVLTVRTLEVTDRTGNQTAAPAESTTNPPAAT